MEPPSTPDRRIKRFPTFCNVQDNIQLRDFRCLVSTASSRARCAELNTEAVAVAKRIMMSRRPFDRAAVWNMITCLVCNRHQAGGSSYWRKLVQEQWKSHFPHIDFTGPTPRTRYSHLVKIPNRQLPIGRMDSLGEEGDSAPSSPFRIRSQSPSSSDAYSTPSPSVPESENARGNIASEDDIGNPTDTPLIGVASFPEREAARVEVRGPDSAIAISQGSELEAATPRPQEFCPGEKVSWQSWEVLQEVRDLLLRPIPSPKSTGTIYALHDRKCQKVKIGITTRNCKTRFKELERQHGDRFGLPYYLPGIPILQLSRLEELVHADLARFQYDLKVPFRNDRGVRIHREWFNVEMQIAEKSICMWWNWMQLAGIAHGREIKLDLVKRLQNDPMFRQPDEGNSNEDDDSGSHERTLVLWDEMFLTGGDAQAKALSARLWIAGCILILVLPEATQMPSRTAFVMTLVLLWFWKRWL